MRTRKAPNTDFFYSVSAFSVNSFSRRLFRLDLHCVKSVRTWRFFCPYFPAFKQNTESNSLSSRIHYGCGELWTRKTPNTDNFHAVLSSTEWIFYSSCWYIHPSSTNSNFIYRSSRRRCSMKKDVFKNLCKTTAPKSLFW